MKVKVLGIQSVDYVSRKTGNPVKGVTLHSSFKDAQVEGESVSSIFVSDNLNIKAVADIRPGTMVDVEYNNRGYVCDLAICKQYLAFCISPLAGCSILVQPAPLRTISAFPCSLQVPSHVAVLIRHYVEYLRFAISLLGMSCKSPVG